jgi:hypothetical protein
LAYRLLCLALKPLMRHLAGDHVLFAIDDTPTARRAGGQDHQDFRGDLASRRWPHPCSDRVGRRGLVAYFCTEPAMPVAAILEAMADRGASDWAIRLLDLAA